MESSQKDENLSVTGHGGGETQLKDLQFWRLQKGVRSSRSGEEALEEGGPVLHPPEPVLTSAVSSLMLCLTRLARDLFSTDQADSVGLP